ncbi:MAG: helix-turn-helix domain-containing protein [Chloroflexota bacterium]
MSSRPTVRDAIVTAARPRLAGDPSAPLERIAGDAGVSRATFYRHFRSRAELLEALDLGPDIDARGRILATAIDLLARDGLRGLSMDEVAERAGVSRASVYRLFPGKATLFSALLEAYAPFAEIGAVVHRLQGRPPEVVLPEVLATTVRVAAPRMEIMRSLMLEISSGAPDAVEAAQAAIRPLFAEVARYFAAQVEAGTIRPIEPMLAAQSVVGPLIFHLLTQPFTGPVTGLVITPDEAARTFAQVALHGLLPAREES